jgi:hypothetical protein
LINAAVGKGVWVVGSVQRRFWSGTDGRQSRLELVALHMELNNTDAMATTMSGSGVAALGRSQARVE